MADEMRGDCITDARIKTPNIRSIASDGGVAFTRNFSPNPVCTPARCCVFTGKYVHDGGHRGLDLPLRPNEDNLLKFLKAGGYHTVLIGRNHLFSKRAMKGSVSKYVGFLPAMVRKILPRLGFSNVIKLLREAFTIFVLKKRTVDESSIFDSFSKFLKLNPHPLDGKLRNSFHFGLRTALQANMDPDAIITKNAIKFIRKQRNRGRKKPFCLYVPFAFPHPPYTVEEPYFSMYPRDQVDTPLPALLDDKPGFMSIMHDRYGLNRMDEDDFKEIRAIYLGMVSRLDDQIGQITSALKDAGLYEQASIFFMSDHGDFAGDYGLVEKWPNAMQDCLLNVPLVVRIPGMHPPSPIIENLTQTIDIFPTILEIAGIEAPYTHFGKSLIPLMNSASVHRDAVFAEGGYDETDKECFEERAGGTENPLTGVYYEKVQIPKEIPDTVCRTVMVRTEKWKLVLRSQPSQKNELYDMQEDIHEMENMVDDPRFTPVINGLKDRLVKWYLETSDAPVWVRDKTL
jgi:choline-sulfatase